MKKIISFILSTSLLASIICIPVSAIESVVETENIEDFCEDVNEMVIEYSDAEFVTPEFIDEEQIAEGIEDEIEINYCPRLIVQSDEPIDTYNAIDVVSGFFNFYIIQFENEKDTNYAYEKYKNNPDIISVEYDITYNGFQETLEENATLETLGFEDYKNGWYLEATGIDVVLEKYKDQNLPKVVVAVLDTGVDLNCEYLQDRLIKTNFNNSGEHSSESEQDYHGHGTMISSLIKNCTTENVKIANYRCGTQLGKLSAISACAAILKAVKDNIKIINCSFHLLSDMALIKETVEYAYRNRALLFVAAGNQLGNIGIHNASPINVSDYTITVGSFNKYGVPSFFTAYGEPVDILGPGEDMPLIDLNNTFTLIDGTSFSTPFVASVYAMFVSIYQTFPFEEHIRVIKNCGAGTDEKYSSDLFGSGIINVFKLFDLNTVNEPKFSIDGGKHIGEVSVELFADENVDIYYTTDQTYPSPTNGTLYVNPITIYDDSVRVRAVAYQNGMRSSYVSKDICSAVLGTDEMFSITTDGILTGYTGNVKYLKIPEVINGITVKDISYSCGFNTAELYGVILPDTVEYLGATLGYYERPITNSNEQIGAFQKSTTIEFIVGNGVKVLGYYGASYLTNLIEVDFPNCTHIMTRAFTGSFLVGASFDNVLKIGREAFSKTLYLREIYLPKCKMISYSAFSQAEALSTLYAPLASFMDYDESISSNALLTSDNSTSTKQIFNNCLELKHLDLPNMESLGSDAFFQSAITRLDLSNATYIYDLPNTMRNNNPTAIDYSSYYSSFYQPVNIELSLPLTLQYCVPATDYKNEYIEYVVYGTAGINSYAEQWAEENDIEFINISQETAIVEDIEPVWDKYSYEPLEFDARGFNRTYQWYGSTDKIQRDSDDKLIAGATDKTFNPDDSKPYPYYYCVMTSTDKDINGNVVSEVTVTSSICENRLYYMFALPDTHIDFDSNLIFTKHTCKNNVLDILNVTDVASYYSAPSYVYRGTNYFGTGSLFYIYENGVVAESYTVIVEGDINGDSVIDVLDVSAVEQATNSHRELTGNYHLAGDSNRDGVVDIVDYQAVVNRAIA